MEDIGTYRCNECDDESIKCPLCVCNVKKDGTRYVARACVECYEHFCGCATMYVISYHNGSDTSENDLNKSTDKYIDSLICEDCFDEISCSDYSSDDGNGYFHISECDECDIIEDSLNYFS